MAWVNRNFCADGVESFWRRLKELIFSFEDSVDRFFFKHNERILYGLVLFFLINSCRCVSMFKIEIIGISNPHCRACCWFLCSPYLVGLYLENESRKDELIEFSLPSDVNFTQKRYRRNPGDICYHNSRGGWFVCDIRVDNKREIGNNIRCIKHCQEFSGLAMHRKLRRIACSSNEK